MKVAKKFKPLFFDKNRILLLYGGAGSGKSHAITQKIISRILSETGHKFLVVRKIARTLKTSVYDLFKSIIYDNDLQDYFEFTLSPLEIKCIINNNTILFVGLDDPEKIKSIAGISSIFLEELTEFTEEDFIQLNLRLRSKTENYKQIICAFNPVDKRSWIFKKWFTCEVPSDVSIYHSTYRDNPFIDKEYKKMLQDLKQENSLYYQIYAEGNWASLSDTIVFKNWVVQDISQNIADYKSNSTGVDFGFSHSSVALQIAIKENELYILREIHRIKLTNAEFMSAIKFGIPEWKELPFYLESAEPDRKKEFQQQGFAAIGAKKPKGSIGFGIDWLQRYKIIIHPSCTNTIEEIQNFEYLKDPKSGVIYPDKFKNEGLFDCIAALRYGIQAFIKEQRTTKLKAVEAL